MKGERDRRVTIGIIALLVVIIIILISLLFIQRSRMKEIGRQSESDVESADETEADGSVAETEDAPKETTSGKDYSDTTTLYSVTQTASASWEQDGKYVTQFDIILKNNSGEAINDWKMVFENVEGGEILSGWNGKYNINNSEMTIIPESYNGTVDSQGEVTCGVQVMFADRDAAEKVSKEGKLYIAGELIDASKMSVAIDNDNSNTSDTSESDSDSAKEASLDKKITKAESGTPYDNHGALSVKGTDLVDKAGEKYQLKGVSTHGLAWFPDYVNKESFTTFRDDWGANIVRLAMYTDEGGGYCTDGNKDDLKKLVKTGIDNATELGMYVIVDWHILHDLTPLKYEDEAKKFFEEISSEYKNSDNIIYEICNEPNGGTEWQDVKQYAEDIIPIIRKNDSNAIVVVGTPNWSQDVDVAANDPITGYDNIMYTLHFYAATHKDDLRSKLTTAKNAGLPIFVTEFSICEASGNGQVDYDSAKAWFKLINDNNLSYCAWNVSNKDEKSSLIKSGVSKTSGWTEDDLSETGVWIRQQMK